MKKILIFLCILFANMASADDAIEIDGIYYNLIEKAQIAEVTYNPNSYSGIINIPESVTYDGVKYTVTSFGESFSGCKELKSVTIPSSISSIDSYAFYNCNNLINVTIGDGVINIGERAFQSCRNLRSIVIPNSVKSIGKMAFYQCRGLVNFTIGNGITHICEDAFDYCWPEKVIVPDLQAWCGIKFDNPKANPLYGSQHLYSNEDTEIKELVIPDGINFLGDYSFIYCTGLTSVNIPNSVTKIGESVFYECSNIVSANIPNSVTSIGNYAFSYCRALNSISLPNGLKYIGDNAFMVCTSLETVSIPSSITDISYGAFSVCTSLKSVTIPYGVKNIGKAAFSGCSALPNITLPNSIISIENSAFGECISLKSVTIPNSVTKIGESSFEGCSGLDSVTIGSRIDSIGKNAFSYCKKMTDFICYAEKVPETHQDAFLNSYIEYATLHVPASSINIYKSKAPWMNFKTFVSIDGEIPEIKKCTKPTISYLNNHLIFDSETEGVTFKSSITDYDIKEYADSDIKLSATYNISVFAIKEGYEDSEVATATLCWIDAEPYAEGTKEAEDKVTEVRATPVLIQAEGNTISVQGAAEGTDISVYNTAGIKQSSTIANKGITTLNTQLPSGSTAIVKIGEKAVKVLVK